MRTAEWINLAVFSFLTALAWQRRLEGRRRTGVTGIGVVGVAATLIPGWLLGGVIDPLPISVLRDWLPAALVLLVYRQAGLFFVRIDEHVQNRFERLDRMLVTPALDWCLRYRAGRFVLTWLEFAYLFCYPMVPFAVGALYLLRQGRETDHFWSVVLPATYLCYVMVPFIQTLPPRLLGQRKTLAPPSTEIRKFNLWILLHASIHANTFPSAHVAASMACALVLLRFNVWVGLAFLFVAVSIALGAVAGRYHYAIDAIAGTAVALAALLVSTSLL